MIDYQAFIDYSNSNPVVSGLVGLWGLTVLTFCIKVVPSRVLAFITKHMTTTMALYNYTRAYHDFMGWLDVKTIGQFRSVNILNGRYGDNFDMTKGIGVGKHLIFLRRRLIYVTLEEETSDAREHKHKLLVTKFGRSHKFFDDILVDIKDNEDKSSIKIYRSERDYWSYCKNQRKTNLDQICLEDEKIYLLVNSLQKFIGRREWYNKNNIPHRFGVLLYGPPGTGKTSLIKGIASYFDKNIYNLVDLDPKLLNDVPNDSLVMIEDIDSISPALNDNDDDDVEESNGTYIPVSAIGKKKKKRLSPEMEFMKDIMLPGLSLILNSMDGIIDTNGRILIITTNNLDKIDERIFRPGRIDLKIEVGYVNDETLRQLFKKFFPEFKLPEHELSVEDNRTPAEFQNMVLLEKSPYEIFNHFVNNA